MCSFTTTDHTVSVYPWGLFRGRDKTNLLSIRPASLLSSPNYCPVACLSYSPLSLCVSVFDSWCLCHVLVSRITGEEVYADVRCHSTNQDSEKCQWQSLPWSHQLSHCHIWAQCPRCEPLGNTAKLLPACLGLLINLPLHPWSVSCQVGVSRAVPYTVQPVMDIS